MSTQESWDLFRGAPAFYAFNPNKHSLTSVDVSKKKRKIRNKLNTHSYENVCVVFKEYSFDPIVKCKSENSIGYLMKKAVKHGLDVCGIRLVYLDDKNRDEYYQLFHEKLEISATWEKPVLALLLRGLEAGRKVEGILGHFNPDMARRTGQKSLRACFGRSKLENCVLQIFDPSKRALDTRFWFGGRFQQEKFKIGESGIQSAPKQNVVQLVAPCPIEKHLLFLSPAVPSFKLPNILQRLTTMGVTLLDIQKIDYTRFQYCNGNIEKLAREAFWSVRGKTYKSSVGFVLKVSRENLKTHFVDNNKFLQQDFDGCLEEHSLEQLIYLTAGHEEYKKVSHLLKKDLLKTAYPNINLEGFKKEKKAKGYDSEDPDEYKDIELFAEK